MRSPPLTNSITKNKRSGVWKQPNKLTKNGCSRANTRFSLSTHSTSSSSQTTDFLRALIAKIRPVLFSSANKTLPKEPRPNTFR